MLKNAILVIAIFVIVLVALTFGESVFHNVFVWISSLTGIVIRNVDELFAALSFYLHTHISRVLIAVLVTIPVSIWVLRSKRNTLRQPGTQRRISIVLAIFLGWLGAHRFYLGQIGWGLGFLVVAYIFAPLAVVLGLIDAIRYLFMDDDTFEATQLS